MEKQYCKECGVELNQDGSHPYDDGWCPYSPQGQEDECCKECRYKNGHDYDCPNR